MAAFVPINEAIAGRAETQITHTDTVQKLLETVIEKSALPDTSYQDSSKHEYRDPAENLNNISCSQPTYSSATKLSRIDLQM